MLASMVGVQAQELKAGAAMRVITPEPLLPVSGGIGKPSPSHIKKGELTVRALVLEKGGMRIAIVGVDNLGWTAVLGDRSRALIKGIPPENILIGATHTHSGPDAYAFLDEIDSGLDVDALRIIAERIHELVEKRALGVVAITHYERLLEYLTPTHVHIFSEGRIVTSGGYELVEQLEKSGYDAFL